MTTVTRDCSMNFRQKFVDIAHIRRSYQINFEDNRINGDEDIVLIRFFWRPFLQNHSTGIFY